MLASGILSSGSSTPSYTRTQGVPHLPPRHPKVAKELSLAHRVDQLVTSWLSSAVKQPKPASGSRRASIRPSSSSNSLQVGPVLSLLHASRSTSARTSARPSPRSSAILSPRSLRAEERDADLEGDEAAWPDVDEPEDDFHLP